LENSKQHAITAFDMIVRIVEYDMCVDLKMKNVNVGGKNPDRTECEWTKLLIRGYPSNIKMTQNQLICSSRKIQI